MKSISSIEGIGGSYAERLKLSGISTVEGLLEAGGEKQARQKLSERTGISEKLVLKWVNMADLFRVKGIAGQYAELLERSGVDTVKELAQRNPQSLYQKMKEVNKETKVARTVPGLKRVESWVSEAKGLPRKVTF